MAEIVNITSLNPDNFEFQDYSLNDSSLITSFETDIIFNSQKDIIEYFIYDINNNILFENTSGFPRYKLIDNLVSIDPEADLKSLGYDEGQYNTLYNFVSPILASSANNRYFISQISPDRTEIRLDTTSIPNDLVISSSIELTNNIVNSTGSYYDFYLDFGGNQLVIANNALLDTTDPNNPTVLIKLYEALPLEFSLKSELWVVTKIANSVAYNINIVQTFNIEDEFIYLKGPNTNIGIQNQINNTTNYSNLSQLSSTDSNQGSGSLRYQLNSLLAKRGIDINIDYSDYSNFIHFSSAQTRLENFYYKLSLIEQYQFSASLSSNPSSGSFYVSSSNILYQNKINEIITGFDNYEYYLYYTSGSTSWPKTNSTPPYVNVLTSSPTGMAWFATQSIIAEDYDVENNNALTKAIPSYILDDSSNAQYDLFVEMVGQYFDTVFLYTQDITNKYNADNRVNSGVSKDLVADILRDLGVKIYQNNFSTNDLYSALLGLTPSGSLFNLPFTTGSLPTPTGFEYINTYITASNTSSLIPTEDLNSEIYKRIYANLPYLLKKKGTVEGLRALLTIYGIPDTILRINEFGGKDKDKNTWDYWQNEYNYTFSTSGSGFVNIPWDEGNLWPIWNLTPYSILDINQSTIASKTDNQQIQLLSTSVTSSVSLGFASAAGGIVAPNGNIYMVPRNQPSIIEYNPTTNISQYVGPDYGGLSAKWNGAALGGNGKIYSVPNRFNYVLEFDPTTNNIININTITTGNAKWYGGVTAPNGFIYCAPVGASRILKIDPSTSTLSEFGNVVGASKYRGAVIGQDGKIYFVPDSAIQVMVVDPTDDSISFFGNLTGFSSRKWEGGILAPNGKIYCMPGLATLGGINQILVIEPSTQTTYLIPFTNTGFGGCLGPDGNIYGPTGNGSGYYKIDPNTDIATVFPDPNMFFESHLGAVLGLDGAIYLMSFQSGRIIRISDYVNISENRALSIFYNKGL